MAVSIMAFTLLGSRLLPGPSAPSAGKPKGARSARSLVIHRFHSQIASSRSQIICNLTMSGEGATKYFDAALGKSDYYCLEQGIWGGKGAERVGLVGEV